MKRQIPVNNQIRKTIRSLTQTIANLRKAIKNNASLKGDVIVLVCAVLLISGCSKSPGLAAAADAAIPAL